MKDALTKEEVEIPVAYCSICNDTGPVVVEKIEHGEWLDQDTIYEGVDLLCIYCPGCNTILNMNGDVEVKWYTLEDLPKVTGWKFSKDDVSLGGTVNENVDRIGKI